MNLAIWVCIYRHSAKVWLHLTSYIYTYVFYLFYMLHISCFSQANDVISWDIYHNCSLEKGVILSWPRKICPRGSGKFAININLTLHLYRLQYSTDLLMWASFLSLAQSKLRLCSANHRAGYFSNLACDWPSIVWAYSEQETENRPRHMKYCSP